MGMPQSFKEGNKKRPIPLWDRRSRDASLPNHIATALQVRAVIGRAGLDQSGISQSRDTRPCDTLAETEGPGQLHPTGIPGVPRCEFTGILHFWWQILRGFILWNQ